MKNKILITGTAGFIGFHLVEKLIKDGRWDIIGLDNINDYYDVNLKYARLREAGIDNNKIDYLKIVSSIKSNNYRFIKLDLTDKENILKLFENEKFNYVVNLAAQAGVRYSLTNPDTYIQSNVVGFLNVIEACRYNQVKHLVYASSSSVYGINNKLPFSTSDNVDHPISIYAATKKSNELMAHTYSYLYNLPTTGLRFFTVYGPWGRPDMALFKFTKAILEDKPIEIYNNGNMLRDFTYIDDIIDAIVKVITVVPTKNEVIEKFNPATSSAPYKIYNIGNSKPVLLNNFIETIERELGKSAKKTYLPIQPGDVKKTHSNIEDFIRDFNYKPKVDIKQGIKKFLDWYNLYYKGK